MGRRRRKIIRSRGTKGEWAEMPMLITDEMLNEFCLVTEEGKLADELKKRYDGIADRLTLYTPFVPEENKIRLGRLDRIISRNIDILAKSYIIRTYVLNLNILIKSPMLTELLIRDETISSLGKTENLLPAHRFRGNNQT